MKRLKIVIRSHQRNGTRCLFSSETPSMLASSNCAYAFNLPLIARHILIQMTMVETDRPKFLKTNLMLYNSQLSDADFKKFADMQAEARKGNSSKMDGNPIGHPGCRQCSKRYGHQSKVEEQAIMARAAAFREAVDARVIQYQNTTGRRLTTTRFVKSRRNLQSKLLRRKNLIFSDETKRAFELNPDEDYEDLQVPAEDRKGDQCGTL